MQKLEELIQIGCQEQNLYILQQYSLPSKHSSPLIPEMSTTQLEQEVNFRSNINTYTLFMPDYRSKRSKMTAYHSHRERIIKQCCNHFIYFVSLTLLPKPFYLNYYSTLNYKCDLINGFKYSWNDFCTGVLFIGLRLAISKIRS